MTHSQGSNNPQVTPGTRWGFRRELADGPLDIIGDVHGELGALQNLLRHLGYGARGEHREGRRLVFLGDLVDRGPDSPGVVRWVAQAVERGNASMVLGNHDLSVVSGRQQVENTWLFAHGPVHPAERPVGSAREAEELLAFLREQPVVMEREDLRVVHACWDPAAVEALSGTSGLTGPAEALAGFRNRILSQFQGQQDPVERNLALQNGNPLKVLTSGPEQRAREPFFAAGKLRHEARRPWWVDYREEPVVVFGHYWRIPVAGMVRDDGIFGGQGPEEMLGAGRAMCIDYSVGARAAERRAGRRQLQGRLAALRWPERELIYDDGQRAAVKPSSKAQEAANA